MSCAANVVVMGAVDLAAACDRLRQLEARWSRFLPSSDITRLNTSDGRPTLVSDDTIRLVSAMVEGWHLSRGLFDPTLLLPLMEAGYVASRTDPSATTTISANTERFGSVPDIVLDSEVGLVQIPRGTALDPGGIGKGLAADIVVDELMAAGATGALVEIGGDLRVRGESPDGGAWLIAVDDESGAPDLIRLEDGGVATSSVRRRRWSIAGDDRHHLLDPTTGSWCVNGVESCTVVAGSAAHAEAFTKMAFVVDPGEAVAEYESLGLAARLEVIGGRTLASSAWQHFHLEVVR